MFLPIVLISIVAAAAITGMVQAGYGFALFVTLPIAIGAITDLSVRPATVGKSVKIATVSGFAVGFLLLAWHVEGFVCLVMALPLALPLSWMGAAFSFYLRRATPRHRNAALFLAILLSPATVGAEAKWPWQAPIFSVTSSIEVNAPPEAVWHHVVSFSELPEEREWLFHSGVAYPLRAEITGTGPGAIRKCVFSTGPFVEPIEVWDAPRLLRFSVTENPAPMEEWTPYGSLDAPHLHGYLVSKQGQFHLTPLPGGRTLLEGTTWYQHHLEPASYWRLWSDFVIHRIHLRVLRHVKALAEGDVAA